MILARTRSPLRRPDDRPTIALCIPSIAGGGAERQVLQLARSLDPARWRVLVITLDGMHSLPDVTALSSKGIGTVGKLRNLLRQEGVRVLQAYLVGAQVYGLAAKLTLPDLRFVVAVRSSVTVNEVEGWKGKVSHSAVFTLHKLVDQYVFNSEAGERILGSHLPAKKRRVIFNGIDTERFRPDPAARERLVREIALPAGAILIGVVANVNLYKGYETLVRAAAAVTRTVPNGHFVIAGEHSNSLGQRIKALVDELSLGERWHFLGPVPDVERILPAFDVLCSASWTEGFSNSIAEAMSCGVPCVVTDVGDSARLVGETGEVAPPNDPEALADSLRRICLTPREELAERGRSARSRITGQFGIESMVRGFEKLYEQMLGRGPGEGDRS